MKEFYSILTPVSVTQVESQKFKYFAQTSTCLKFAKLWVSFNRNKPLKIIKLKMRPIMASVLGNDALQPENDRE